MNDIKKILDLITEMETPVLDEGRKKKEDTKKATAKKDTAKKTAAKKEAPKKKASAGKSEYVVKGEIDGRTTVITVRASNEDDAKSNATNNPKFKVISVRKKFVADDDDDKELDESTDRDSDSYVHKDKHDYSEYDRAVKYPRSRTNKREEEHTVADVEDDSVSDDRDLGESKQVPDKKIPTNQERFGKDVEKWVKDNEKKKQLAEKWGTKMHTAEKDKGKWDGYTISELKAKKAKLMNKEERTADEQKTVKQINFALRAKQKDHWGKIKEDNLAEVITKKTPAGEIIKDFQKSKNPKFKGKSKEQRKKQALGAYYGMHPEKSKKPIKEVVFAQGKFAYDADWADPKADPRNTPTRRPQNQAERDVIAQKVKQDRTKTRSARVPNSPFRRGRDSAPNHLQTGPAQPNQGKNVYEGVNSNTQKIGETAEYAIFAPTDFATARALSKGTYWEFANPNKVEAKNWWDRYFAKGPIYFAILKSNPKQRWVYQPASNTCIDRQDRACSGKSPFDDEEVKQMLSQHDSDSSTVDECGTMAEGRLKEVLTSFIDEVDNSGEVPPWAVNDGDERTVLRALERILNNGLEYANLPEEFREDLIQHGLRHLGFHGDDADADEFDDYSELNEAFTAMMSPVPNTGQESRMNINTNMSSDGTKSVSITADGDQADALLSILKLAGIGHMGKDKSDAECDVSEPECHTIEPEAYHVMAEEAKKEKVYANEPDECVDSVEDAITQRPANDLNRSKKQFKKEYPGDNPMTDQERQKTDENKLWKEYTQLKKNVISLR